VAESMADPDGCLGRGLDRGRRGRRASLRAERSGTSTQRSALLNRLVAVERQEIPRLRAALVSWVDDPYLAREMRERSEEVARLRRLLGID
jgi:hypothetical protein